MMITVILASGVVLVSWLRVGLALTGLGLIVRRALGYRTVDSDSLMASFWTGWGGAIAILQVWHLVMVVDRLAFLAVLILGAAGLASSSRELLRWSGRFLRERGPGKLAVILAVAAVATLMANHAIAAPTFYDTGLYYLDAVRWATDYPIVPGLGNLHGRLAFNNASFLFVAMLEGLPGDARGHNLADGMLFVALVCQCAVDGRAAFSTSSGRWSSGLFMLLVTPAALGWAFGGMITGASPDSAVFVLSIVVSRHLLALTFREGHEREDSGFSAFVACFLAAVGVAVKISMVVLGVLTAALALVLRSRETRPEGARRTTAAVAAAAALVLVPWAARGVILSGYVAYPLTVGAFPVDWRVPEASVVNMRNQILGWSRLPGVHWTEVLGSWEWVVPWLGRLARRRLLFQLPTGLVLLGLGVAAYGKLAGGARAVSPSSRPGEGPADSAAGRASAHEEHRPRPAGAASRAVPGRERWLLLVPAAGSIVFWFLTAPDPRFAGASFWILGAATATVALCGLPATGWVRRGVFVLLILSSAAFFLLIFGHAWMERSGAGSLSGFHDVPVVEFVEHRTRSGLVIYSPKTGGRAWARRLPSTPVPDAGLRLRRDGDLGSGFRTEPSPENTAPRGRRRPYERP